MLFVSPQDPCPHMCTKHRLTARNLPLTVCFQTRAEEPRDHWSAQVRNTLANQQCGWGPGPNQLPRLPQPACPPASCRGCLKPPLLLRSLLVLPASRTKVLHSIHANQSASRAARLNPAFSLQGTSCPWL